MSLYGLSLVFALAADHTLGQLVLFGGHLESLLEPVLHLGADVLTPGVAVFSLALLEESAEVSFHLDNEPFLVQLLLTQFDISDLFFKDVLNALTLLQQFLGLFFLTKVGFICDLMMKPEIQVNFMNFSQHLVRF